MSRARLKPTAIRQISPKGSLLPYSVRRNPGYLKLGEVGPGTAWASDGETNARLRRARPAASAKPGCPGRGSGIPPCRILPLPPTPAASPPRGSRLRGSSRSVAYGSNTPPPGTPAVAHGAPPRRVNRWHARQPLVGITWCSWLLTYLPSSRAAEAGETPRPLTALKPAPWPSLRGSLPAITRSPQCARGRLPLDTSGGGRGTSGRRTQVGDRRGIFRVRVLCSGWESVLFLIGSPKRPPVTSL